MKVEIDETLFRRIVVRPYEDRRGSARQKAVEDHPLRDSRIFRRVLCRLQRSAATQSLQRPRHRSLRVFVFSRVLAGRVARLQILSQLFSESRRRWSVIIPRMHPNQLMKPTAPFRSKFSVLATTPCRGLSLSR